MSYKFMVHLSIMYYGLRFIDHAHVSAFRWIMCFMMLCMSDETKFIFKHTTKEVKWVKPEVHRVLAGFSTRDQVAAW